MLHHNQPPKKAPAVDLRAKYQLAPQPANVAKISGLVNGRENASMDEITEIIKSDSGVTQRLLSLAYPKQQARLGATVQMATARLGVNRVIVVLVCDLLNKAVVETFQTMAEMELKTAEVQNFCLTDHGYLTGSVRFAGEANGQVTLAFSPHLSMLITAKLVGGAMGDDATVGVMNDTIGELVNIVTGNLQSKLSDAGLPSEVALPEVKYLHSLPKDPGTGGSFDEFYFRNGTHLLVVQLSIDPSAPKKAALRAPPTHGTSWRANRP